MTEMSLEQVRDELREWGKVDHSPLCVNCGYWADAIDEVIKAQGEPPALKDSVVVCDDRARTATIRSGDG